MFLCASSIESIHISAGPNTSRWWKNVGPDLPLLFKLHEICSVDFRKIVKIVTTRCQILSLKCTKIDFGWGSAPDPAGGAYSAPPDPLAGFKGPTSKGRGGEVKGAQGRVGGMGPERRGGGRKGIGEGEGGEGEWGSHTHYFRLKSCTGFGHR